MLLLKWDDNMKDKRKTKSKKPTFELWEVIVITLVASIIMGVSTGCVVYNNKKDNCFSSNDSKYLAEFEKSYKSILENYYDDIDENKLVEAAISGMLSYLGDPYTTYLNENSTNVFNGCTSLTRINVPGRSGDGSHTTLIQFLTNSGLTCHDHYGYISVND